MNSRCSLLGLRSAAALLVVAGGAATSISASAQSSASDYTSAVRYDAAGRAVGTIAPDPDGTGPLKHAATRTTIDPRGLVTKVETGELATWQSETVLPKDWTGFSVLSSVETTYDANRRKVKEIARGSNNAIVSLTQFSYDSRGRLECTAVRMNSARWGASQLPASACALGVEGNEGPDRITKTIYDLDGRVLQIRRGVGTLNEVAEVTYSYTLNDQIEFVADANGNRAQQRYDDHDRQVRWVFPDKARPAAFDKNNPDPVAALDTAGAINEADFEEYTYDDNGNRLTHRKRDGSTLSFTYDALNRMTVKTVPGRTGLDALDPMQVRNVYYAYDNRDLQTSIRFDSASGPGSITAYDGFGRQKNVTDTMDGSSKILAYHYDKNGNRTQIKHPDSVSWQLEYDKLNRATRLREGTTSIGTMTYNNRGQAKERKWAYNSLNTVTTPTYDMAGRTASLTHDMLSTGNDVTFDYGYIPSGQLDYVTRDNDAYAWDGQPAGPYSRDYTTNGLNQYESAGNAAFCHDDNGNLTADGGSVYLYDIENRLVEKRAQGTGNSDCEALSYAGALDAKLHYDPLGRLYKVEDYSSGVLQSSTRMLYDGDAMVAEYNGSGTMLRRYVHGTNADADDPLIRYEGAVVSAGTRRYLLANHQGSIIGVTNYFGNLLTTLSYDEYGIPGSANNTLHAGRFQYTGQVWLEEAGLYYYKARVYSPQLGRFLQTDPIGYEDTFNLYAYVGNDPINAVDPTGESCKLVYGIWACSIDVYEGKNGGRISKQAMAKVIAFNQEYTRQVNRLMSLPDKTERVKDFYKSYDGTLVGGFEISRSEAAENLISRPFVYIEGGGPCSNANFCTPGGPGGALRSSSNAVTYVTDSGLTNFGTGIVHDGGMHGTSQELEGGLALPYSTGSLGTEPGATGHQQPYSDTVCKLLAEKSAC